VAKTQTRKHAARVAGQLERDYPDAWCALRFRSPLQLLVATILSAQCTDERVNAVTPQLFRRYKSAADYAAADLRDLERAIQSTGFFRNKAKSIKGCCQAIVEQHGGKVPADMDALVALPGVGRKTANVVLGTAFDHSAGIVVDTHVGRISRRLGLTSHMDAVKVEDDLMALLPQSEWTRFAHRMIQHGRRVCLARRPKCTACSLSSMCPQIGLDPRATSYSSPKVRP
jgi:endonuclease-3